VVRKRAPAIAVIDPSAIAPIVTMPTVAVIDSRSSQASQFLRLAVRYKRTPSASIRGTAPCGPIVSGAVAALMAIRMADRYTSRRFTDSFS
jgi:hypothetical protein